MPAVDSVDPANQSDLCVVAVTERRGATEQYFGVTSIVCARYPADARPLTIALSGMSADADIASGLGCSLRTTATVYSSRDHSTLSPLSHVGWTDVSRAFAS